MFQKVLVAGPSPDSAQVIGVQRPRCATQLMLGFLARAAFLADAGSWRTGKTYNEYFPILLHSGVCAHRFVSWWFQTYLFPSLPNRQQKGQETVIRHHFALLCGCLRFADEQKLYTGQNLILGLEVLNPPVPVKQSSTSNVSWCPGPPRPTRFRCQKRV